MNSLIKKVKDKNYKKIDGVLFLNYKGGKNDLKKYYNEKEKKEKYILLGKDNIYGGKMYGGLKKKNITDYLKKNNNIYEIILTDEKRKVYFDIDCYFNNIEELFLYDCIGLVKEYFPNPELAISGSISQIIKKNKECYKHSFHFVLNNYYFENEKKQSKIMKQICNFFNTKLLEIYKLNEIYDDNGGFDLAPYMKDNNMKQVNQSKINDDRIQNIILNNDIKKHIITRFFNKNIKNAIELPIIKNLIPKKIKKSNTYIIPNIDENFINIVKKNEKINISNMNDLELLNIFDVSTLIHNDIFKLCCWAINTDIDFATFWDWNKKKSNEEERRKKWEYYWDYCNINYKKNNNKMDNRLTIMNYIKTIYPNVIYDYAKLCLL